MAADLIVLLVTFFSLLLVIGIPAAIYWYFRRKGERFTLQYPLTKSDLQPYMKEIDIPYEDTARRYWIISYWAMIASGIALCIVLDYFSEIAKLNMMTKTIMSIVMVGSYSFAIFLPYYFAIIKRGVAYLLYALIVSPIVTLYSYFSPQWQQANWLLLAVSVVTTIFFLISSYRLLKVNDNRKLQIAQALDEKYGLKLSGFWKRVWLTRDIEADQ